MYLLFRLYHTPSVDPLVECTHSSLEEFLKKRGRLLNLMGCRYCVFICRSFLDLHYFDTIYVPYHFDTLSFLFYHKQVPPIFSGNRDTISKSPKSPITDGRKQPCMLLVFLLPKNCTALSLAEPRSRRGNIL